MIRLHWNLTLLLFSSEEVADEVEAVCQLAPYTLVSLSSTSRLLDEDRTEDLLDELQHKGYTPRVDEL